MANRLNRIFARCAPVVILSAVVGCGSSGPYVWAESLPAPTTQPGDILISEGDALSVRVFSDDRLSTRERVRPDGRISVPGIGEIVVCGKCPAQLVEELQQRLQSVVKVPWVTVTFEQGPEVKISVVGQVRNAGVFTLDHGSNALHAIAAAGGLNDYADGDKVFVVRKSLPQRIRMRYSDLRAGSQKSKSFTLQTGDIVVVE